MFKKIIFALLLGIFITLFFAQHDAWTHKKIVNLMQKIAQESLGGNFSCAVQSVNFFAPSLLLHDLEMTSIDNDTWWWRCKKCEVHCSWLQLLYKGSMDQYVVIEGFECNSRIENARFAIESHIIAMMQKSFLPFAVELKSMIFKNAQCHVVDECHHNELFLFFNSSSLRIGKYIKTTMSVSDGYVLHEKNKYIESIATDLFITTEYRDDIYDVAAQVAGSCMLSHMAHQGGCYITGGWKGDRARFSVRNAYNSLIIDPIIITERELRINARFPLSYAVQCFTNSVHHMVEGVGHCSLKMNRDEQLGMDGQLVVEDVVINNHHVCDTGKIIFNGNGDDWKMRLGVSRYNQEYKGTGHWNQLAKQGEINFKNGTESSTPYAPYWRIKPNNFLAQVTIDHDTITGSYDATITHTLRDVTHTSNGILKYVHGQIETQGYIDDNQFCIEGMLYPHIALHHGEYKDKENKKLILFKEMAHTKQIIGSVSFPFIRSVINNMLKYDVQGEGSLDIIATTSPTEIKADIALNDATIRLPQTYNFIDGLHAHCVFDIAQKSAFFENINCSLHTGNINCLRATMHFDEQGFCNFIHAPFVVDNCLLNIKKDLFAAVSGNFLFSKESSSSSACVDGHIIIDKAQLKENLFSGVIQKQLLSYTHSAFSLPDVPLACDIAIETKHPIIVDTGFLQTNAHVNVRVQKNVHEPVVTGSVVLQSGTLNFPYKPLYISRGVITFSPEQLFDPTIELVARNKIKKYDVSLSVEGSLSTHHIALDATPPLSEEQIVGLLLVGAEEHSLNSMMPALIVQNLKNFIFSHNQSSFFDKYFKPLLGSFNINLVPSFTDQTGRGGLRGALEISLDDRWRATIQKNFSLTEDTKFELEFLLSDDITLRAIRDERRDLGGEVEMRWKF